MRNSAFTMLFIFFSNLIYAQSGTFEDKRDGKIYKYQIIGNQTWMAEDLAFRPNDNDLFTIYEGNRYIYMQNIKNVCPIGWHIPSKKEWEKLIYSIGGEEFAGRALKSQQGWKFKSGLQGSNTSGLNIRPTGTHIAQINEFIFNRDNAVFWTSTVGYEEDEFLEIATINLHHDSFEVIPGLSVPYNQLAIRCIKDSK